jgi:hypothetical protein
MCYYMAMAKRGLRIPSKEEIAAFPRDERAALAAACLEGLEPGRQPMELFLQLARITVASIVELVPLRQDPETDTTQVLLTQRPARRDLWAGKWHVPGTVALATDDIPYNTPEDRDNPDIDPTLTFQTPLNHLLDYELKSSVKVTDGPHLYTARMRRGSRGTEVSNMFWARVETDDGIPLVGRFFDVNIIAEQPPEGGLVTGHTAIAIQAAMAASEGRSV